MNPARLESGGLLGVGGRSEHEVLVQDVERQSIDGHSEDQGYWFSIWCAVQGNLGRFDPVRRMTALALAGFWTWYLFGKKSVVAEKDLTIADFNILNMNIQGAELRALKGGAKSTLPGIEAINTEINFEEPYEDGALASELDDFLALHGFKRVATTTPHHPTWGDAFYVRA